jgi:hypothetical protein
LLERPPAAAAAESAARLADAVIALPARAAHGIRVPALETWLRAAGAAGARASAGRLTPTLAIPPRLRGGEEK